MYCEFDTSNYDININVYENGTITRKYGKNFYGPLAKYNDSTFNIYFRNDRTYTLEISVESATDIINDYCLSILKYEEIEIGESNYQLFEINSNERYGMGIVLKSINSINYSISIAYDQNTLNNANKSNIVNLSLSMGEKIFISIDTVIDSDFIFEIMSI